MIERFLKQTSFTSVEDYNKNLEFIIPEHFNFAYDVMDAWAEEKPDGLALLWTNDQGEEIRATYAQLKEQSDQAAAYLQSLGIGKGDPVMLILKRRYEWWIVMLALCKIGAIVIPATHMLTKHDIVYRNTRASVKAIICVDDAYVCEQIRLAMPESPTVKQYITITDHGKPIPEGFRDYQSEVVQAPQFQRPAFVNNNEDTMLMYFTSGTSGEPKMVAHDYLYAMGHLTTGVFCGRHRLGQGRLGQVLRTVVCWCNGLRLRPREVQCRHAVAPDGEIQGDKLLCAAHHLPLHDSRGPVEVRPQLTAILLHRRRGAEPRRVRQVL